MLAGGIAVGLYQQAWLPWLAVPARALGLHVLAYAAGVAFDAGGLALGGGLARAGGGLAAAAGAVLCKAAVLVGEWRAVPGKGGRGRSRSGGGQEAPRLQERP